MARVTEDPLPMPEIGDFEAQQEALDSIDDPILRFPRADGYALYRVVEMEYIEPCECCGRGGEPLLQHIPYGDAWKASGATINGLTTTEAERRVEA